VVLPPARRPERDGLVALDRDPRTLWIGAIEARQRRPQPAVIGRIVDGEAQPCVEIVDRREEELDTSLDVLVPVQRAGRDRLHRHTLAT
jgi:hypothetical protein